MWVLKCFKTCTFFENIDQRNRDIEKLRKQLLTVFGEYTPHT